MKPTGELYACLYAKEFPAQAVLRLRPELRDLPVVVVEGEPPLETVCSFNAKARYLGIVRGITRVELDTFSSLIVLPRSHTEEVSTHAVMLECAGAFSPRLEDRSDGSAFLCVIDIAGTEKLLGPPEVLARELLRRVQVLGVSASIAISRNFHASLSYLRASPSLHPATKAQLSLHCLSKFWTYPESTRRHLEFGASAHLGPWPPFQKKN